MRTAIVTYKNDTLTERCVKSLDAVNEHDIVIYDNAAEESTAKLAADMGTGYRKLNRVPLAAVWNRACVDSFEEHGEVFILNNDTWGFEGMNALEQAIAGNRSTHGVFFIHQIPQKLYQPHPSWFSAFVMTDWCFRDVGPFDEGFEICNFEDDDYMVRLMLKQVKTVYVTGCTMLHDIGASSDQGDTARWDAFARNAQRFAQKWGFPRVRKEDPDFVFPGLTVF